MKKLILSFIFLSVLSTTIGQQLFYQDIFYGGTSVRLFSTWDSSFTIVNYPANASIKKAYLICANPIDNKYPITVTLNNTPLTFDTSTQISSSFYGASLYPSGRIHAKDITNIIDLNSDTIYFYAPSTNGTFPDGENQNPRFWNFTLYISYQSSNLSKINTSIFVNNKNPSLITIYNFNNINSIDSSKHTGLSLLMGFMMPLISDGSYLKLNNDSIGYLHGSESNSINGFGSLGQFDYYNDTLYGYGDDTSDSLMNQADALADISSYLINGTTNFNLTFEYENPGDPVDESSNPAWATFLTYSTPCDTFSTSINIPDTTICYGESLVLQANGGGTAISDYQWEVFGNVVGYGDSLAIQPDSSLYYIVKIKDSNGCMKTEMVHIIVNSPVQIGNVVVSPTLCGSATGNIAIENVSGGTSISGAYIYSINGTQNTNISIYYNEFNNLQEGTYNVQVTDFYGCTVNDTVAVGNYINTIAQFSASSQSGEAPLTVAFTNQSSNANSYAWYINNEESVAFAGESYTFDSVGVYEVTLYAYGNDTTCVDSASVFINVVSPFRVFIPTYYDASLGSLYLDTRGTKTVTLEIFDEIGKLIYVETKTVTDGQNEFWKGYNARGIYLYRILAEGTDGKKLEQGGKLVLMK